jgi:hypothetical protein
MDAGNVAARFNLRSLSSFDRIHDGRNYFAGRITSPDLVPPALRHRSRRLRTSQKTTLINILAALEKNHAHRDLLIGKACPTRKACAFDSNQIVSSTTR